MIIEERLKPVTLDLVIPVYNEELVLDLLFKRLYASFSPDSLAKRNISRVQLIFVDDGSKDASVEIIKKNFIPSEKLSAKIVILSRNFGHQNAVTAGMSVSAGDVVAIIDSDLQDPPELILEMVEKWRHGYDIVNAVRKHRKESKFKVFCYWAFYRLLSVLAETHIAKDSGDFCLMDKRVVACINGLDEKLRFPRGLRSWVGFKKINLEYSRSGREAGESKYSFKMLYKLATDGLASMSIRPLKIAQALCILYSVATLVFGVRLLNVALNTTDGIKLLIVGCIVLVLLSATLTFFVLYIMSAYLGRMYLEVKGRPSFIAKEIYQKNYRESGSSL